jgi:ribosome-associated toxin RatA of RatAB toxin-antitoxin module
LSFNLIYRVTAKVSRFVFVAATIILGSQILPPLAITNSCIPAATAKTSAPESQTVQLDDGKPTICDEMINGKSFCVSRIIVKAKLEKVWQVLTDYKHAVQIFPLLKKCELLESHGNTRISKHEIAPSGLPETYEYILEVHEIAPTLMEWHRLSGDFKEVDGSWKLEPVNSGKETLVTYASHVTGGFFMPQILIKRQAHIDMPSTLVALKKHTEHSIEIAATTRNGTAAE